MYQILIRNSSYGSIIVVLLAVLLSYNSLIAQSRNSLEKTRNQVDAQIQKTSQAIWKTRSIQKKTTKKLHSLDAKLQSSTSSILELVQELDSIQIKIERKNNVIVVLKEDVEQIKTSYKKVIRELYRIKLKQQSTNAILVSNTNNSLQKKQVYLRYLIRKLSLKMNTIQKVEADLGRYVHLLTTTQSEIATMLGDRQSEKEKLAYQKKSAIKEVAVLSKKEQVLRNQLQSNRKKKLQLSKKIEGIIRQQIAAAKKAAREKKVAADRKAAIALAQTKKLSEQQKQEYRQPNYKPALIPPEIKKTSAFADQKGRLMSPIYQGRVVANFGRRRHPTLKDVYVNNNGIDIKGQYNSIARSVYEGVVVSIFAIPGMNNAIMVKHGDYFTTYSNIAQVYVKQGQAVKTGAQLGSIGRDLENGGHLLHFELWNGKQKENPAHWLAGS